MRPEFIERSKLFVPVYLDGDTVNAQAYAEKFGVRGYPTMIVFDPAGVELTRIPGGIDLQVASERTGRLIDV
jgi:thioredoxin-related protein